MKKSLLIITAGLFVMSSIQIQAETLAEAEIPSSQLKISNDGTGIIKFSPCDGCKNVLVKVNSATKAYLDGVAMSVAQARLKSRPGFVGVQYALESKEVRTLGFTK